MHRIPAVLVALLIPQTVLAAWPNQATVNLPVSRATGDQVNPTIVANPSRLAFAQLNLSATAGQPAL